MSALVVVVTLLTTWPAAVPLELVGTEARCLESEHAAPTRLVIVAARPGEEATLAQRLVDDGAVVVLAVPEQVEATARLALATLRHGARCRVSSPALFFVARGVLAEVAVTAAGRRYPGAFLDGTAVLLTPSPPQSSSPPVELETLSPPEMIIIEGGAGTADESRWRAFRRRWWWIADATEADLVEAVRYATRRIPEAGWKLAARRTEELVVSGPPLQLGLGLAIGAAWAVPPAVGVALNLRLTAEPQQPRRHRLGGFVDLGTTHFRDLSLEGGLSYTLNTGRKAALVPSLGVFAATDFRQVRTGPVLGLFFGLPQLVGVRLDQRIDVWPNVAWEGRVTIIIDGLAIAGLLAIGGIAASF